MNRSDGRVMFPLIRTAFLRAQDLLHFVYTVLYEVACPADAINMLETYFFDDRAMRVNDEIRMDLTFNLVKMGSS